MASIKKRLKNIEAILARFAAGEKRLVDLIVGLVVENLEERIGHHLEGMADHIVERVHERVVDDLGRRFPDEDDVRTMIKRVVLEALHEHDAELRNRPPQGQPLRGQNAAE